MQRTNVHTSVLLQKVLKCLLWVTLLYFLAFSSIHSVQAAVAPNWQRGTCGPYYIWYQMSAEDFPYPIDYVYLCSITFDISDVVDDFDFVYFTDYYAPLDRDQDGISDLYYVGRRQSYLEWKPQGGCVGMNLWECQKNTFGARCGYAMIHIQPKPGFQKGKASIPVYTTLKYQPNGVEFTKRYPAFHEYADCVRDSLPDFVVQKNVEPKCEKLAAGNKITLTYTIKVQYTQTEQEDTTLTTTLTRGADVENLALLETKIDNCPSEATCTLLDTNKDHIQVELKGLSRDDLVKIKYVLTAKKVKIPENEALYFTNTISLSDGTSSHSTIGISREQCKPPRSTRN